MNNPVEIAKQLNQAFQKKDKATLRSILHPNYTASCAMSKVNSPEEAIEMVDSCSFECRNENSVYVAEGNKVAHFFDWVIEAPFKAKLRVAQYLTLENGQVRTAEMFYDTAVFPKEMLEEMGQKKKEASLV